METDPNLGRGADAGRRHGLTGNDLNLFANGYAEALDSRASTVAALDPKAFAAAERRRIARILAHPVPASCEQLRAHAAFDSDLSPDEAIALLETAAQIEVSEKAAGEMYAARAERVKELRSRRA